MKKYDKYKENGMVGAPTGKAKRIVIRYNEEGDTMGVQKGSCKPYPDWQNQHGPVGASADGVTEAEADLLVESTAKMLSQHMALGDSDDDSTLWGYSSAGGGGARAAAATVAAGAQATRVQRSETPHSASTTPNLGPISPPKLTASERAAKLAEEMEAKADADQNAFGLLHAFQQEQRLKSQLGPSSHGTNSRLQTPSIVGIQSRRIGSPHSSSSPTSSFGKNFSNLLQTEDPDDDEDGEEVVRFDTTTPGGLAGHILATGGYGCPDPTKPNPVIIKQPLSFPEDEERGAKTPPRKKYQLPTVYSPLRTTLTSATGEESPTSTTKIAKKQVHVKDVRMSRQPWSFQEAVLDAQIIADAQLDRDTIKTISGAPSPNTNFANSSAPARSAKATMLLPHYHQQSTDLTRTKLLQLEQTQNREIYKTTGTVPLQALLGAMPSRRSSALTSPTGATPAPFPQSGLGKTLTRVTSITDSMRPTSALSHSSMTDGGGNVQKFEEGSPLTSGRLEYSQNKMSQSPPLSGTASLYSPRAAAGREPSMSSIAAESPFMRQKQLIGERILKNTVACVDEKSSRIIRTTSVQKRRLEWASANQIGGAESGIWQSGESNNPTPLHGGDTPTVPFGSAFVGNIVGRGIVARGRRTSIKMLPPTSMTTKDVFIAQQRLLNANLRQMAAEEENEKGQSGFSDSSLTSPYGALAKEDENLLGDTDEALGQNI